MERKTLTLKRPTIEKESESTEPVIQRRRKQVVVNTPGSVALRNEVSYDSIFIGGTVHVFNQKSLQATSLSCRYHRPMC
ncbi:hypothetical protein LHV18_22800, partial [Providencia rettgeri]|nr:hypothetical protein [Providencia rettgeri]